MNQDEKYLRKAIELALEGIEKRVGGPFGAVVVKDGKIIGQSSNTIFRDHDPTAHAEVQAIRDACKNEQVHALDGCILYSSCEPCPMCYGAVHYAKIEKVIYASKHATADKISGFGVDKIYNQLSQPVEKRSPNHIQLLAEEGKTVFHEWENKPYDASELKKSINDK